MENGGKIRTEHFWRRFGKSGKGGPIIKLNILGVVEPIGLKSYGAEKSEWEELNIDVDSGAGESVVEEGVLESIETQERGVNKDSL